MSDGLRSRSRVILDGPDRAQARAYLKGIGFDDDALSRPIVGIANTYSDYNPCHGNVPQLIEAIMTYVAHHNETPTPFTWTAQADGILAKVARAKARLDKRPSV